MSGKDEVEDPLKPLDQIYAPDERQANFVGGLEDIHSALSAIVLNDSVPREVRQLFETAKNLSLYSWFVYRFHQASELIAFAALEMALRERYLADNPVTSVSSRDVPALFKLLEHAKKEKWITNEGFPSLYERAKYFAQLEKSTALFRPHEFDRESGVTVEEPNEEEIESALAKIDMVEAVTKHAHRLRNPLAHGSNMLGPSSISILRTNAEVINQIY